MCVCSADVSDVAAKEAGQRYSRGNRVAGFDRRRSALQRGAGHGQDAQRFPAAAHNFYRIVSRVWILVYSGWKGGTGFLAGPAPVSATTDSAASVLKPET